MTCPRACTPASVRPAQVISGASRRRAVRSRAWRSTPATVGTSGWAAKPRKAAPSYATRSLQRCVAAPAGSSTVDVTTRGLDELDARHRRVVTRARAALADPRVPARTVLVAGGDLLEEFVGHVLVPDQRHDVALVGHAALAGRRDALLGDRAH